MPKNLGRHTEYIHYISDCYSFLSDSKYLPVKLYQALSRYRSLEDYIMKKKLFLSVFILFGSLSGLALESGQIDSFPLMSGAMAEFEQTSKLGSFKFMNFDSPSKLDSNFGYVESSYKLPSIYDLNTNSSGSYDEDGNYSSTASLINFFNPDNYGNFEADALFEFPLLDFTSLPRAEAWEATEEEKNECFKKQSLLNMNLTTVAKIDIFDIRNTNFSKPDRVSVTKCYEPSGQNLDYCSVTCIKDRRFPTEESEVAAMPSEANPAQEGCCSGGICTITKLDLNCNVIENTPVADSVPDDFSKFLSAVGLASITKTAKGKVPLAMIKFCEDCLSPDKEELAKSQKILKTKLNNHAISHSMTKMIKAAQWLKPQYNRFRPSITAFLNKNSGDREIMKDILKDDFEKFLDSDGDFDPERMIAGYQCLNIDAIKENIEAWRGESCSSGLGSFRAGYESAIGAETQHSQSILSNANLNHRAFLNHEKLMSKQQVFNNEATSANVDSAINGINNSIIKNYDEFNELCNQKISNKVMATHKRNEKYASLIVDQVVTFTPKGSGDESKKKLAWLGMTNYAYAILEPSFTQVAVSPNFICEKLKEFKKGLIASGKTDKQIKLAVKKGFNLKAQLGVVGETLEEKGQMALINLKQTANRLCGKNPVEKLTNQICEDIDLNDMHLPKRTYDNLLDTEKAAAVVLRCVQQSKKHREKTEPNTSNLADYNQDNPPKDSGEETGDDSVDAQMLYGAVTPRNDKYVNENMISSNKSRKANRGRGVGLESASDLIKKNNTPKVGAKKQALQGGERPTETIASANTIITNPTETNEVLSALKDLKTMQAGGAFGSQANSTFPSPLSRSLEASEVSDLLNSDSEEAAGIQDDFLKASQNVNEFINENGAASGMNAKDRIDNVLAGKQDSLFPEDGLAGNEKAKELQAEIDALKAKMSAAIDEPENEKLDRALGEISELKRTIASFNNRSRNDSQSSNDRGPASSNKAGITPSFGGEYNTGTIGISNEERIGKLINGGRTKTGLSAKDLKDMYSSDPSKLLTLNIKTNSLEGFEYNNNELVIQSGKVKVPVNLDNVDIVNGEVKNIILNGKVISFEKLSNNSQKAIRLFVNVHHFKPKADQFKALVGDNEEVIKGLEASGDSYEDLLAAMILPE